jgi:predicted TIM-barrel fold metal-dependent hydrolase
MIIDCHAHLAAEGVLPSAFFDSWAANISSNARAGISDDLRQLIHHLNDDPEGAKLLTEMAAANIEKTVLLIIDFGVAFKESTPLETLYLKHRDLLLEYPGKFVVFAGVDPRRGAPGLELFERSLREWKFRGLKLYPPCGYSPSDRSLFPYYELCQQFEVPVLTHVGPTSSCLSFKHTRPEDVDDAAHAFPRVNFILGHAGVTWHEEAGMLAEYRSNIYLDLSGFQTEVRRKHFDCILGRHKQRGTLRKLVFGTDWPIHRFFGNQKYCVEEMQKTVATGLLTTQELDRILHGNASELLGLAG